MGLRLSVAALQLQRARNAQCNAGSRCTVALQRVATGFATLNGWGRTSEDRLTAVAACVALALQYATACNAQRIPLPTTHPLTGVICQIPRARETQRE